MDDDKTLKFPPRRPAAPSDDTTTKLPMHMQGDAAAPHPHKATFFPGLKSAEARQTASSSMDSTQIPAIPDLPTLEYEHVGEATPGPPLSAAPTTSRYASLPSSRKKKRHRSPLLLTILLLLLLLGGGTLAFGYYYFQTNIQAPLANFIHPVSRGQDEPPGSPIPPDDNVAGRAWNILLMGSDNDGKYTFPAVLTQVMMVVHVDTTQNTVTMVSIPRDSWVYVPEIGGMHKIDQAFFLGATQQNSFDDGVRMARLTVEKDYGITIDRYAWVGLDGFAKVIDTLGGLDIDVTHPIVDDSYPDDTGTQTNDPYAYKRLYIAPGPQRLNGLQALEYVRSRHADLVGDIGRTQRQQQVLAALKLKLNLTSVLGHLQQLIGALKGKVYTDLSEQEMLGFASFGHGLTDNAIQRITLGPGQGNQDYGDYANVYDPSINDNQDVVIPHCENIQPVMNRIFALGDVQSCNVTGQ